MQNRKLLRQAKKLTQRVVALRVAEMLSDTIEIYLDAGDHVAQDHQT